MTRKRIGIAALVILVLAVGGLLGGILTDSPSDGPQPAPPAAAAADQALAGFSLGDTEGLVAQLQGRRSSENPKDAKTLALLGLAYQQLARETGDPSYYTKSAGRARPGPRARCRTTCWRRAGSARSRSPAISSRMRSPLGEKAKEISPDDSAQLRRHR